MFQALKLFVTKELIANVPPVLEGYTITILEPIHCVVRGIDTESLIGVVLTVIMLSFHVWVLTGAERFVFTALLILDSGFQRKPD